MAGEDYQKKLRYKNVGYQSLYQKRIIRLIVFLQRMYPRTELNLIRQISIKHLRFEVFKTVDDIITVVINGNHFTDPA